MENNKINLLNLNNDILNIIGGYVKKDNKGVTSQKVGQPRSWSYDEKEFDKKFKMIHELNEEYLTLKKLNLKKK